MTSPLQLLASNCAPKGAHEEYVNEQCQYEHEHEQHPQREYEQHRHEHEHEHEQFQHQKREYEQHRQEREYEQHRQEQHPQREYEQHPQREHEQHPQREYEQHRHEHEQHPQREYEQHRHEQHPQREYEQHRHEHEQEHENEHYQHEHEKHEQYEHEHEHREHHQQHEYENEQQYQHPSLFEDAWMACANQSTQTTLNNVRTILSRFESRLNLTPGFLCDDVIISHELDHLVHTLEISLNQPSCNIAIDYNQTQELVTSLLRDIKIVDMNQDKLYGSFQYDGFAVYCDNNNDILYKESLPDSLAPSSVSSYSWNISDDDDDLNNDIDDTASLMEIASHPRSSPFTSYSPSSCHSLHKICPSPAQRSPSTSTDNEIFNLNELLKEIDDHHSVIDENFAKNADQVSHIKLRNLQDLKHLNRLINSTNVMHDKIRLIEHQLRAINLEVFKVRELDAQELPKPMPSPVYKPPDSLLTSVFSDEDQQLQNRILSRSKELSHPKVQHPQTNSTSWLVIAFTLLAICISYYFAT